MRVNTLIKGNSEVEFDPCLAYRPATDFLPKRTQRADHSSLTEVKLDPNHGKTHLPEKQSRNYVFENKWFPAMMLCQMIWG